VTAPGDNIKLPLPPINLLNPAPAAVGFVNMLLLPDMVVDVAVLVFLKIKFILRLLPEF
jgi:hypothetical protein